MTGMDENDRQQASRQADGMPRQLDAMQFARTSGVLDGVTDVALLERVAQECSAIPALIDWSIAGQVDDEGACWLELALAGSLTLQCQRCLEDVTTGVRSRSRFRLVPAGEDWGDQDLDDDSYEALRLEGLLDVRTLIEDEVLLSLPAIALHDHCSPPGEGADADGAKASPFAELGRLKQEKQ